MVPAAAASAGTVYGYAPTGDRRFRFMGFGWSYASAEANTDNTLDFVIAYGNDGSTFTALHTNANPVGLLDTAAPLVPNVNIGDAASSGGAGVAVTPTQAVIAANQMLRFTIVRAGTGTIPAIDFWVYGRYV
jgi:hypothetical protein